VTITYDEALREQIRARLAAHDRRAVTDPTKRHAAVAVVLVDSEVGEDRVDPVPADGMIAELLMEIGLDGRMVDVSGGAAFLLCRRASRLNSHAAQWALPGGRQWCAPSRGARTRAKTACALITALPMLSGSRGLYPLRVGPRAQRGV